jgi:hypothetical protein
MPIVLAAVGMAGLARRRPTSTRLPTDSARTPAARPTRLVSSALDAARRCPSLAGPKANSLCSSRPDTPTDQSIAQPMPDSNHRPAPLRDLHVYAAYSTCPVADTGSHPRVSMPSHLPGPTVPIPVSAIHTVAGRRWPVTAQGGALKPISIGRPQPRPWDRYRELRKPFCNIAGGVAGPPCGTPSTLSVTTPFSMTPALSHLSMSRSSPPSLTR